MQSAHLNFLTYINADYNIKLHSNIFLNGRIEMLKVVNVCQLGFYSLSLKCKHVCCIFMIFKYSQTSIL